MTTIEELTQRKSELREKAKVEAKKLNHIKNIYYVVETKYNKLKAEYEAVDRELATLDGRYTVGKKPPSKPVELTVDQILAIASKLGVTITKDDFNNNEE